MLYPVYVHLGDDKHAHSITIPDFPGCYSAADNWNDVPRMVQEAAEVYFEGEEMEIPAPSGLEDLQNNKDFSGGTWMVVDIDISKLDTRKERINLSVPASALREIDEFATAIGATRSGFMVKAALEVARNARVSRETTKSSR